MWRSPRTDKVARRVRRSNRRGDPGRGLEIAASHVHRRRRDPEAWVLWARQVKAVKGLLAAEEVLREGLRAHPTSFEIRAWLARCVEAQGRINEARGLWLQLRRERPDSAIVHIGLGWLAAIEGAWEESRAAARRALEREPDTAALGSLAAMALSLPEGRAWAVEILRQAVERFPRFGDGHLMLGLLLEEEDPEAARRHLRRARRIWGRDRAGFERERAWLAEWIPRALRLTEQAPRGEGGGSPAS